ncbi:MAG: recombinase family protein [Lachnospiraceae bacterium]|nr:recombinase family protein [Lachnospiraceae bacterium]
MKGNRAVLYLRLSKEDADKVKKGDDSASIKNQRLLLTDYALSHHFKIVKVYADDDESGLYDDRPGFEKMIMDGKLGEFDLIIAKTQSRFSRNMEHIEKYLHHDLPNLGIRFIGVVDGVDTEQEENKKSRQINGLVNEWYCEDLSKNIRSSLKAKMKNGEFLGASCPYGYQKDPKNHNHLVIDAYAAEVVRKIYRLYLSGYGKAKIGSMLSAEGILIPTLYKRKVLGENYHNSKELKTTRTWSYQTIHTILNNETYTGKLIQNKTNTLSYKDKKKKILPKEQWIIVENTHEPIIEPEIFEMAQKLQNTRARMVDSVGEKGIFAGLLYCADCRHAMVRKYARRGERGFTGYICRTYKTQGKQFCTSHSIEAEELKEAVLFSIKEEAEKILRKQDIEELEKLYHNSRQKDDSTLQLEHIQRRIEKAERWKRKTYHNFMEELISEKEYRTYVMEYDREIKELQGQKDTITEQEKLRREKELQQKERNEDLKNYIQIQELTRDLVLELIDRIEVGEEKTVTIYYKFQDT